MGAVPESGTVVGAVGVVLGSLFVSTKVQQGYYYALFAILTVLAVMVCWVEEVSTVLVTELLACVLSPAGVVFSASATEVDAAVVVGIDAEVGVEVEVVRAVKGHSDSLDFAMESMFCPQSSRAKRSSPPNHFHELRFSAQTRHWST